MKQATVAGITVAMGPVLQGCGPDPDDGDCITKNADQCIRQNDDGLCHWDPEKIAAECILEPDFDEALFNATAPASLQPSDLQDGQLNWGGCAEYDAVIAQRCVSKCELDLSYRLREKASANDESGRKDIRYLKLCSEYDYFEQEAVGFNLPTIVPDIEAALELFAADPGLADVTFDDVVAAVKPDWTPFGGKVNDERLQMQAVFLDEKVVITNGSGDQRRVDPADADPEDNNLIAMEQIKLAGMTMADYAAEATAGGFDTDMEAYFEDRFLDYGAGFGKDVYLRFLTLDTINTNANPISNLEFVNIVQADLEAGNFFDLSAFESCSMDRNCGLNYATGQCAELHEFCAQFEEEQCKKFEDAATTISIADYTATGPGGATAPEPADLDGRTDVDGVQREFEGYVSYESLSAFKCQYSTEGCAPPEEFIACNRAGFPTQVGEENICIFLDLVPQQWSAFEEEDGTVIHPGYDVQDLTQFALLYEVVDASGEPLPDATLNPRGCLNSNAAEIDGMTYLGGVYGYEGPVCTLVEGYDCVLADDFPEDPDATCNNTKTEICFFRDGIDGACVTANTFYEKYITNEPESVTVVFPEPEEETEDFDAEDFDAEGEGEGVRD